MPNGEDKNWVRLCAAIDGYRARYRSWPPQILLPSSCLADLEHLLAAEDFKRLSGLVKIEVDNECFAAAGDQGRMFDYMKDGFPRRRSKLRAEEWLNMKPKGPTAEEVELYHKMLDAVERDNPGSNPIILS